MSLDDELKSLDIFDYANKTGYPLYNVVENYLASDMVEQQRFIALMERKTIDYIKEEKLEEKLTSEKNLITAQARFSSVRDKYISCALDVIEKPMMEMLGCFVDKIYDLFMRVRYRIGTDEEFPSISECIVDAIKKDPELVDKVENFLTCAKILTRDKFDIVRKIVVARSVDLSSEYLICGISGLDDLCRYISIRDSETAWLQAGVCQYPERNTDICRFVTDLTRQYHGGILIDISGKKYYKQFGDFVGRKCEINLRRFLCNPEKPLGKYRENRRSESEEIVSKNIADFQGDEWDNDEIIAYIASHQRTHSE